MEKKICSKCGRKLSLTNEYFEPRKDSKDGFRGVCRECRNKKFLNSIKIDRYNEVKIYIENNSDCMLLENNFINVDTKMKFRCGCGNEFETTFYNFKNRSKRQCNECSGQSEWDFNRIYKWINKNSKCTLVKIMGRDKNYSRIIRVKCNCGDEFITDFRSFKKKKDKCCNLCSDYKYYNIDIIKEYVENNSECKLISTEYINIEHPLEFMCRCGEVFNTTFTNFIKQGKRHCDKCGIKMSSEKRTYSYDEVKAYIEENSECKLISNTYSSCYEKLKLLCSCGEEFEVSFDKFKNQGIKNKVRCDICNKAVSKPVMFICDYLESKGILYEREYKFKNCKYKKLLPFDFYIPFKNICIEYDGEFHYKETSLMNNLELQKMRDDIKTKYCKNNNIKLIRIPYWEQDNISKILDKELAI